MVQNTLHKPVYVFHSVLLGVVLCLNERSSIEFVKAVFKKNTIICLNLHENYLNIILKLFIRKVPTHGINPYKYQI
jgi:hypothetical protein